MNGDLDLFRFRFFRFRYLNLKDAVLIGGFDRVVFYELR